jgi:hypothetical protein
VTTISIEQALYSRSGAAAPELLAQSPGFLPAWQDEVGHILTLFGDRPEGVRCPGAIFAQPLGKRHVIVTRVADLPTNNGAVDMPLGFHVLVVFRDLYRRCLGDPFLLAESLPPDWRARGNLPVLSAPPAAAPRRTVAQVQQILKRIKGPPLKDDVPIEEQMTGDEFVQNSESPALLGGAQVLVDGGRLVFRRATPDTGLLEALWTLLPNSNRAELWPASFAFSNELGFDALVVPQLSSEAFRGYTTEDQAADYPEGRYELNLQTATEAGNQRDLDALFDRRSWNDTWRIAVTLFVAVIVLTILSRIIVPLGFPPEAPVSPERQKQAMIAAGIISIGRPLETAVILPAAREEWRKLRPAQPGDQKSVEQPEAPRSD